MPTRGFRNVSEEHVYDPAHQEEALSQSQHTSHLEDSRASFQDNPYEHTFKMEPGQLTNGIQSSRQLTHRRNSGMSFVHEEHFGDRRYIGSRGEHWEQEIRDTQGQRNRHELHQLSRFPSIELQPRLSTSVGRIVTAKRRDSVRELEPSSRHHVDQSPPMHLIFEGILYVRASEQHSSDFARSQGVRQPGMVNTFPKGYRPEGYLRHERQLNVGYPGRNSPKHYSMSYPPHPGSQCSTPQQLYGQPISNIQYDRHQRDRTLPSHRSPSHLLNMQPSTDLQYDRHQQDPTPPKSCMAEVTHFIKDSNIPQGGRGDQVSIPKKKVRFQDDDRLQKPEKNTTTIDDANLLLEMRYNRPSVRSSQDLTQIPGFGSEGCHPWTREFAQKNSEYHLSHEHLGNRNDEVSPVEPAWNHPDRIPPGAISLGQTASESHSASTLNSSMKGRKRPGGEIESPGKGKYIKREH